MPQRNPPRFTIRDREPLSAYLLQEGLRRGLYLYEIADMAKLNKRTLERINHECCESEKRVSLNLTTMHKLSAALGARLALIMDDGTIYDPLRDQT